MNSDDKTLNFESDPIQTRGKQLLSIFKITLTGVEMLDYREKAESLMNNETCFSRSSALNCF